MRVLALLGLVLLLGVPSASALGDCVSRAGLSVCTFDGGTYREESVVYDGPAYAAVRHVEFDGFAGPDETYEVVVLTRGDAPVGSNGAALRYRCLRFNGGPDCTLLVIGAEATLDGLGYAPAFVGYRRDFAEPGAVCAQWGDFVVVCRPAPWPLPPL